MGFEVLAWLSAGLWLIILLLPWRPWGVREALDSETELASADLGDITVLIPARNEAAHIKSTLEALARQGQGLHIIVIDDQSTDNTAELARQTGLDKLTVIQGQPLPEGWSGKLWALQQGRQQVQTPRILLLDADIELQTGILATLKDKMQRENLQLVSLMAQLHMQNPWEKLLLPAFIHFFKLVYPFRLTNDPRLKRIAAAAGGCILVEKKALDDVDAFASLRDSLIDDCTLARKIKEHGYRIWLGLSHSIRSTRSGHSLADIWNMVARTAFTQLHYSLTLLLGVMMIMFIAYLLPLFNLFNPLLSDQLRLLSLFTLAIMAGCYLPTLRYYRLSVAWALLMPVIASLFLAMTWSSAIRYWTGHRSSWKQRVYDRQLAAKDQAATPPQQQAGE